MVNSLDEKAQQPPCWAVHGVQGELSPLPASTSVRLPLEASALAQDIHLTLFLSMLTMDPARTTVHTMHISHGSTIQFATCRRLAITIRTVGLLQHTEPKWIILAGRLFMYNSLFPCNYPEAFSTEELHLSPDWLRNKSSDVNIHSLCIIPCLIVCVFCLCVGCS